MADIFLGIREEAGQFPIRDKDGKETGEMRDYHHFLVNAALESFETTQNTVGTSGYDVLGYTKSGDSFKDSRKIPAEKVSEVFGTFIGHPSQLDNFVMKECNVLFDRKGSISKIIFCDGSVPHENPIEQKASSEKSKKA